MSLLKRSSSMQRYFKFKEQITAHSVLDILKNLENSDFNEPHEGQKLLFEAYDERIPPSESALAAGLSFEYKYRTLTVAAGRRWGKSHSAAVLGLTELLVPNSSVMILAPALSNCEVIFKKIHRLLKLLGITFKTERERDMELVLENNSTLRVCSVENASSRLGLNWTLLICDESKLIPRNLITQTLLPMGFDAAPLSRVVYISSPSAGFFETVYNYGQSKDPKWKSYWSINSPTYTNPTIPKEELEEWKRTMPADLYATEVMGLFTSSEGRVFSEFDRELNTFDIEDYPYFGEWVRTNYVVNSVDPGYQHYFASVHFVYVEEVDHIFVFEEYNVNNTVTEIHAENLKRIEASWGMEPTVRFGDPASAQMLADFAVSHDLYFMKAEKGTQETVNQTNAQFFQRSSVTGKPKLLISRQCSELCRQVTEVSWKIGRDELTREQAAAGSKPFQPDRSGAKTDYDLVDALRYGIFNFLKNGSVNGVSVFSFGGDDDTDEDNDFNLSMNKQGLFRLG